MVNSKLFCAFIGCAIGLCVGCAVQPKEIVLSGGAKTGRVVLAAEPEDSSRLAAEELTNYVGKASGKPLSMDVVIGTVATLPDVPADVKAKLAELPGAEAFWTGLRDGKLWFVGKEEASELRAVYWFLENKLGVRWFQIPTPEDPGEFVPQSDKIVLTPFSVFKAPDFGIRRLDNTGAACYPLPERSIALATRLGYQVPPTQQISIPYGDKKSPLYKWYAPRLPRRMQSLGGWHGTFKQGNPREMFKTHPEYFALVDGKRQLASPGDEQYCLSNEGMRQNVVNYILKRLAENGGNGEYLFGQADTPHGLCECDACKAMDGKGEGDQLGAPQKATRFFKTVNLIADKVYAKYPNADLRMWAYATYRKIPSVKIDPRIKMVWYCPHGRCYGHMLDDPKCARNVGMFGLMKDWMKVMPELYTYDYLNCTPHVYACCEEESAHDLRLMKRLGVVGWKEEIGFTDQNFVPKYVSPQKKTLLVDRVPSNWQWLYVTGHLLWDSSLDLDAMLDDIESKYYGVAYPAMKKYHALRRKLWRENANCMGYPTDDQRRPTLLDKAGAKDELLGCLDEAERLVEGVENRCRCRKDGKNSSLHLDSTPAPSVLRHRIGLDRQWLQCYWIDENEALKKKRGKVIRLREVTSPVVLDGDGSDAAWGSATYVDDLVHAYVPEKCRVPAPAAIATSYGVTYDKENLYFLITAKEPQPGKMKCGTDSARVWDDDCVEVMLFPPSAENRYYHLAVNAKGTVYGASVPGGRSENAFGAEAKARVLADRYVIELKVPLRKIHPIAPGETWRVQMTRNRLVKDDLTPKGNGRWCFEGGAYNDILSFRNMEFGQPYLGNGTFSSVDERGWPKGWTFISSCVGVVETKHGKALKLLSPQSARKTMAHRELGQKPVPRKLSYTFTAFGKGRVKVSFDRYTDTPDAKAKYGYNRARNQPDGRGGVHALTSEPQVFTGTYEVPAGEWATIAFSSEGGEAYLKSVMVEPLK